MEVKYINGLPAMQVNGVWRKLAALKPTPAAHSKFRLFREVHPTPDPSSWKTIDLSSSFPVPIRDQGQHGSCAGHAGVTAMTIVRKATAQEAVSLSCTFPYAQVNGGQDNGSSMADILNELEQKGTCTTAECGVDSIFTSLIPASAYETAKKYEATEALIVSTFDEVCEALNRGFPVAFGVLIGNNFASVDNRGVVPLPDMTIGGHALCAVGLYPGGNNSWIIKFQNSWGLGFGMSGYAYMTSGYFQQGLGAYAITHTKRNPEDEPPPMVNEEASTRESVSVPSTLEIKAELLSEDRDSKHNPKSKSKKKKESDDEPTVLQ